MKRFATACTVFTISTVINVAYAQQNDPKYEFGLNLGFLVYQGDLTPKRLGSFETQKFSIGLHASRFFSPSFSVRLNLLRGKLSGDEAVYDDPEYRKMRALSFTTPVTELSVQFVWNVLGRNYADKGFSPYVFAGGGFSFLKIKPDASRINTTYFDPETSEVWAGLADDTAHALPKVLPVIPVGVGVKYFFSQRFGLNAETSYRLAYTDYLDGFSQAVNPKKNDHYLNYSIGVVLRTGKKNTLACPVMRY
ncbi:MAG: hypothetical protein JNM19_10370 [Chitinophagaceae bacterium]|nr:hypothetical protein [Chitinophagaceae bacterium]